MVYYWRSVWNTLLLDKDRIRTSWEWHIMVKVVLKLQGFIFKYLFGKNEYTIHIISGSSFSSDLSVVLALLKHNLPADLLSKTLLISFWTVSQCLKIYFKELGVGSRWNIFYNKKLSKITRWVSHKIKQKWVLISIYFGLSTHLQEIENWI